MTVFDELALSAWSSKSCPLEHVQYAVSHTTPTHRRGVFVRVEREEILSIRIIELFQNEQAASIILVPKRIGC